MASAGHVPFNSNAVLPVSDSGVKYVILFSGNISRWLLLVMCPLTAMQSYLFLNLVLNMLFVQHHLDMFPLIKITYLTLESETGKTALHVTFNSNAVLPVSESGVKYAICSAGTYLGDFCWSCDL